MTVGGLEGAQPAGFDQYFGPVPVDFSHYSTGSTPVPVKLDILCDLLSGNFNLGRCGKIRSTDPRMRVGVIYPPWKKLAKFMENILFHGRDIMMLLASSRHEIKRVWAI